MPKLSGSTAFYTCALTQKKNMCIGFNQSKVRDYNRLAFIGGDRVSPLQRHN